MKHERSPGYPFAGWGIVLRAIGGWCLCGSMLLATAEPVAAQACTGPSSLGDVELETVSLHCRAVDVRRGRIVGRSESDIARARALVRVLESAVAVAAVTGGEVALLEEFPWARDALQENKRFYAATQDLRLGDADLGTRFFLGMEISSERVFVVSLGVDEERLETQLAKHEVDAPVGQRFEPTAAHSVRAEDAELILALKLQSGEEVMHRLGAVPSAGSARTLARAIADVLGVSLAAVSDPPWSDAERCWRIADDYRSLSLRRSMSYTDSNKLAEVTPASSIDVLSTSGAWVRVRIDGEIEGYLSATSLAERPCS